MHFDFLVFEKQIVSPNGRILPCLENSTYDSVS